MTTMTYILLSVGYGAVPPLLVLSTITLVEDIPSRRRADIRSTKVVTLSDWTFAVSTAKV